MTVSETVRRCGWVVVAVVLSVVWWVVGRSRNSYCVSISEWVGERTLRNSLRTVSSCSEGTDQACARLRGETLHWVILRLLAPL